ncbi:TonB-dependent receptor plug domain-containing protein [Chitinophaga caeni]|nr:TonB-dependent receptor [Chitinophaga caeni]
MRQNRIALKNGFLTLALALPMGLSAQEMNKQLDPVTVTATIQPVSSSRTGRNLTIIKGSDIASLPVHSLDELLRYVPGLEVQARGPMGAQSDFVVRGGTFQQVLVIIDGLRVNDPNTGHFSSYIPVTPGEIDRIEILKGASSAIYGSEAVGGVIHIITKTFHANNQSSQDYDASVTGGAYGLWNASGNAFINTGKTAISAGVLSNNTNGQSLRGIDGFVHANTISLAASQQLGGKWRLSARSSYDTRNFAAQGFYTTYASDTASENVNTWWNQLQLDYQQEKEHLSIRLGYKSVDDTYKYNPSSVANSSNSQLWQLLTTYERSIGKKGSIVTGVQGQSKSISSNDRGDHDLQQGAVFFGYQQGIGDGFTLNPALRLDWNEGSGTELVPQMNLSYRHAWYQLRASAGKTIRDADFTERYNNYNKAYVSSGRLGNPDLSPEHSWSYEAGADIYIGNHFRLATTVFRREQDDVIDWADTPFDALPRKENLNPAGSFALAKNISEVNTTGWEADVYYHRKMPRGYLFSMNAGFVWMDTQSSDGNTSFYISSHAKLLTNFSLQLGAPRWEIALNGLYKIRNAQSNDAIKAYVNKSYFVMNGKASYHLIKDRCSVFLQVDNIFDRNYQDLLAAQMPGRWIMGGAQFHLHKN